MDKKYQVFISSTFEDLKEVRSRVSDVILEMNHFPIGMEYFSADDNEQWETIKNSIDSSDYYVVIIGHRYGSQTKDGISYTEKEYDYASKQGIPILAFIRNRDIALKVNEREEKIEIKEKLDRFIDKAKNNKMCDFWNQSEDLVSKVSVSLYKQFVKNNRLGWIKNDKYDFEKLLNELSTLSNENIELRKENLELKSQSNMRKPKLALNLRNDNNFEFKYVENDILVDRLREKFKAYVSQVNSITLEKPQFHKLEYQEDRGEDNSQNIMIYQPCNEWQIKKYNDELPNEQEILDYVLEKEKYFRCMSSEEYLSILIENQGTIKASNLDIQIELPDEMILLDFNSFYDMQFPYLKIPMNPLNNFYRGEQQIDLRQETNVRLEKLTPNIECTKKNIRITMKELMHCRCKEVIKGFILVPLKRGEFSIKCNIICDECENAMDTEIKVNVI
jgi:hypothetical protein